MFEFNISLKIMIDILITSQNEDFNENRRTLEQRFLIYGLWWILTLSKKKSDRLELAWFFSYFYNSEVPYCASGCQIDIEIYAFFNRSSNGQTKWYWQYKKHFKLNRILTEFKRFWPILRDFNRI